MSTFKINISQADAAVTEYVTELSKDTNIPTKISNRIWIEFLLERHGIVGDVRARSMFYRSHAIWYACLILTHRVREVSRLEKSVGLARRAGGTTENTIRRLLKGNLRQTIVAPMLQELLEANTEVARVTEKT